MKMNNKIKSIIIISAVIFIAIISLYIYSSKKVTTGFNIYTVPTDSKIVLDGKPVSSGNNSTSPGKHTVEVSHENFDLKKQTFDVVNNQIKIVAIGLSPNNSVGKKWQQDHQKDYLELENSADTSFKQDSADVLKKYPIISNLPQDISPIFRIDYGVSKRYPKDPTRVALYISSDNPADKVSALQYIYKMGYDPSDYEIIFEGL